MRNSHDEWPICDEEATSQETNKGIVTSMMTTDNTNNSWYYFYVRKFKTIVIIRID